MNKRRLDVGFEVKELRDDGSFSGYGSVFGVVDSYGDIVVKGAFKESLRAMAEKGRRPALLWQHRSDEPIGVYSYMSEDDIGLKVEGQLALNVTRGREAYELMKMGAVDGLSIGFWTKDADFNHTTGVRSIKNVELVEVSVCTFPANGEARITNVKAAADEIALPKDAERILRDAGFGKVDACGFVSRVMRLGEERRDAAMVVERSERAAAELLRKITESVSR